MANRNILVNSLTLLFFVATVAATHHASADTAAAEQTVKKLQAGLLASMQAGSNWNYSKRFRELESAAQSTYQFSTISQVVLGSQWQTLQNPQQQKFVDTFSALAVAQMADNFDTYSGQSFVVIESKAISRGQVLVKTVLRGKSGKEIPMDYVLANIGGKWRIINVVVEGVSDLAVKRAEYQRTIKSDGFDGLLSQIKKKIDEYGGWPGK